ncbi:MAG: hypothetical protein ACYS83_01600 [Planctomycetota bacterium]|jgi:hypothetical protein
MRSVWAVATNTIKQALRMRIAAVFIILLIILLPVMGFSMTGDGTLKGKLQTFVSYGLSLAGLLLSLLTIIVSIYSLTSDIKQRQIYTVITKPIRRFQLLVGKLLGVVLLNAALLVLFSAIIYAVTIYTREFSDRSEAERAQVENEFVTARASLTPVEVDVGQEVDDLYNKLEESGQLEQVFQHLSRKEIIAQLTSRKKLEKQAAAVGDEIIWEFEAPHQLGIWRKLLGGKSVRPDPNQSLFIKYKFNVSVDPADLLIHGRWIVGDVRQIRYGTRVETPLYNFERKDLVRSSHEIEVPADAIAEDGYFAVAFFNPPQNNTVVIFPLEGGMEVLHKGGTFAGNFIRAVVLIWLRLILLACLGILASTFLSFPVALLLCLVVFSTANFSAFVLESFEYLSENLSDVYSYTLKPIIQLLPQFDKFNPTKYLVSARLLSWSLLGRATGFMICIKAVLLLLLALLIFSYREIARIII